MNIRCEINGKRIEGNFNTHMPLSELVREQFAGSMELEFDKCAGNDCMKCLVFIEDFDGRTTPELIPSCLVPVFRIDGKKIITKKNFLKTDEAKDVYDACRMLKKEPCPNCIDEKIMIFSYIVGELMRIDDEKAEDYIISSNLEISPCNCLLYDDVKDIIKTARKIRGNRLV